MHDLATSYGMRNPLTIKIESYFGAFLVLSTAIFFGTFIYRSAADFDSEIIIINSQRVSIKTVSSAERALINDWMRLNNIQFPDGKGYRYMIRNYPNKPWI